MKRFMFLGLLFGFAMVSLMVIPFIGTTAASETVVCPTADSSMVTIPTMALDTQPVKLADSLQPLTTMATAKPDEALAVRIFESTSYALDGSGSRLVVTTSGTMSQKTGTYSMGGAVHVKKVFLSKVRDTKSSLQAVA